MDGGQEHDPAAVEASWKARQDETSGQTYYWNAITGETSWEAPPHPAAAAESPSVADLVAPWTQAFDDDGRVYYLNTETMETRWTPPPTAAEQQDDTTAASNPDVAIRGQRPSTAEQMDKLNRLLSGEGEDDYDDPPEGVGDHADGEEAGELSPSVSEEALPLSLKEPTTDVEECPWMMFANEDDGVPYYYNHITGECLWDPPEEFLRFHQEQQHEQEQELRPPGEVNEVTAVESESANSAQTANEDVHEVPTDAQSSAGSTASTSRAYQHDAGMEAVLTPEFEEKVRQAIASISNTPVSSSRLLLVRTPTQQQLAPRTGRSAGDTTSARSIPNSARPRSGPSRPSSGGAVSRPRTPLGASGSSRLDPSLPTPDVPVTFEEEVAASAIDGEPQLVENPNTIEQGSGTQTGVDSHSERDENALGTENEEDANTNLTSTTDVVESLIEGDIGAQFTADETEAVRTFESAADAVNELDVLNESVAEASEDTAVRVDVETPTPDVADALPEQASLEYSAQGAALTLQCMARCFIARRRVKQKREEQLNADAEDGNEEDEAASSIVMSEDAEVLPSALMQGKEEEASVLIDAESTAAEVPPHSDENASEAPSSKTDEKPLLASDQSKTCVDNASAVVPLSEASSEQSNKGLLVSAPVQEPCPHKDRPVFSTRMPSVLDVAKYFPPRRDLPSSRAQTESSTEQVAITRKKVDMGSPPRPRRTSQQEAERVQAEHEQMLEARRKEEERAQQAQVLEYQRIHAESRRSFEAEKQRILTEKRNRDNQREHELEEEKRARIQAQCERDAKLLHNDETGREADQLVWGHMKTHGRPTEHSVSRFRDALMQALDSAQFPSKMCAERARELHERIERLHRSSWAVDSQLESVELRLVSELHPLSDQQRPLQAKYAAKLRCRLERMLSTVQSWQRVLDEWETNKDSGSTSRYWVAIQARYAPSSASFTSEEARRQYVLNGWRGAAGFDSMLHVAAWNGWKEHVRLLIEEGADVNLVDSSASRKTPLHEACRAGHVPIVELLLRSGARLSAVDISGDSSLHVACRGGWTRVVRILLMAANDLGDDAELSLTLDSFFDLRNGKGLRAIEVTTLPSLKEEMESRYLHPVVRKPTIWC
ncbi:unnamed protein product [Phytophthora lilii]|uniref:Unnamed protein product n=1 Tax=Phytophthora lilii TaxID=2077276 RepID=A0A9W6WQ28_9STRA|nr:unnamed protein product [Phytophthora lilii]